MFHWLLFGERIYFFLNFYLWLIAKIDHSLGAHALIWSISQGKEFKEVDGWEEKEKEGVGGEYAEKQHKQQSTRSSLFLMATSWLLPVCCRGDSSRSVVTGWPYDLPDIIFWTRDYEENPLQLLIVCLPQNTKQCVFFELNSNYNC